MNKRIVQYVRDNKRRRVGAVVAIPYVGGFRMGWSRCRVRGPKELRDRFSLEQAISDAITRARDTSVDWSTFPTHANRSFQNAWYASAFQGRPHPQVPYDVCQVMSQVRTRAVKYFKQSSQPVPQQESPAVVSLPLKNLYAKNLSAIEKWVDHSLDVLVPIFRQFGWSYARTGGVPSRHVIEEVIRKFLEEGLSRIENGEKVYRCETGRVIVEITVLDSSVELRTLLDVGAEYITWDD